MCTLLINGAFNIVMTHALSPDRAPHEPNNYMGQMEDSAYINNGVPPSPSPPAWVPTINSTEALAPLRFHARRPSRVKRVHQQRPDHNASWVQRAYRQSP